MLAQKQRKPSKDEIQIKKRFYNLMFELDFYNKFKKTFRLEILSEENFGFKGRLYLAPGLSFEALRNKKRVLEENLQCLWIMQAEQLKQYADVQIVLRPVDKRIEYQNPGIRPWELYLGLNFSGDIQKNNNNDACMFLLAGATGSGKTRFIYCLLLSWILGCSPNDVWLYISDIAKNEYVQFRDVKHVKAYAAELDELVSMVGQVRNEFNRRKRIIGLLREQGTATNIEEYNKVNPKHRLAYCYLLIDEFSVILPDKTDSKDEKDKKSFILDTIKSLEKTGRSLGIFCFIATQKTTKDELPSIVKNMSAVRISFRANDPISSEVIMGDQSAVGLPDRVAVYSQNGGSIQSYLFAPKITIGRLNSLLEPYIKPGEKTAGRGKNGSLRGIVTYLPKGVSAKEYLQAQKKEDDYIDY